MSTEQPPSIAPKRPAEQPRDVRRVTAPVAGSAAPSSAGPSLGDRLKKAAHGAASAAKTALPSRDERPAASSDAAPRTPTRTSATAAAPAPKPSPGEDAGPRRVRLAIARVDPWSVMKLSFLLSFAIGIMIVVAAAVVWFALDELAIFTKLNEVIATLSGDPEFFDVLDVAGFDRVISLATMIAVADIVLLTALSTIGALLYNIVASMVGGLHLTLTDD